MAHCFSTKSPASPPMRRRQRRNEIYFRFGKALNLTADVNRLSFLHFDIFQRSCDVRSGRLPARRCALSLKSDDRRRTDSSHPSYRIVENIVVTGGVCETATLNAADRSFRWSHSFQLFLFQFLYERFSLRLFDFLLLHILKLS